jgi:hypothetical protein
VVQTRPLVEVMQTSTERNAPGSEEPKFAVQEAVPDASAMPEQPLLRFAKLKVAVIGTPAPTAVAQLIFPVTVLVPETEAETLQPVAEVAVAVGGAGVGGGGTGVSVGISSITSVAVGRGVFVDTGRVAVGAADDGVLVAAAVGAGGWVGEGATDPTAVGKLTRETGVLVEKREAWPTAAVAKPGLSLPFPPPLSP